MAVLVQLVNAVGDLGADLVGLAQALSDLVINEITANDLAEWRVAGGLDGIERQPQLRAQLNAGAGGVGAAEHALPQTLARGRLKG